MSKNPRGRQKTHGGDQRSQKQGTSLKEVKQCTQPASGRAACRAKLRKSPEQGKLFSALSTMWQIFRFFTEHYEPQALYCTMTQALSSSVIVRLLLKSSPLKMFLNEDD